MSALGYNERLVLEVIWRHGPVTRQEIAELTGLTAPAITGLARKLSERDLISISVERTGGRGQPSRPMALNPGGAYAAGVSFTHRRVDVGLIDLSGRLLAMESQTFDAPTLDDIGQTAAGALERLLAGAGLDQDCVVGAGVSVPGDFLASGRHVWTYGRFPALENIDVVAALEGVLPVPVAIENDGASAAIGERLHGVAQRFDTYLFIHIRHGVKAGVVLNGQLYRGANGNAGLIGPYWPGDRGQPRPSGEDLLKTLREAGIAAEDFSDLDDLAPNTTPALKGWIKRAGRQLSDGLALFAKAFDPQAIVVGGNLPVQINQALLAEIDLGPVYDTAPGIPRPILLASSLSAHAGVIGAASVPLFKAFFASATASDLTPNRYGRRSPQRAQSTATKAS